jgi:hypothetical protein
MKSLARKEPTYFLQFIEQEANYPASTICTVIEYFWKVATVLAKQLINIRKQKNRTYQATSRVRFLSEST